MPFEDNDRARASTQTDKLIEMLRRGPVTNRELIAMGMFKYTSRISDARKLGYSIKCQRLSHGLSRYTLGVEPLVLTLSGAA